MRAFRIGALVVLAGAMLGGCTLTGGKAVPIQPTADAKFNTVWDASAEVLRDYRFRIDRQDRRAGVMTTYPMLGRHWFEFWRPDAVSRVDLIEGTLQTLYRRAKVVISRIGGEGSGYVATVAVTVYRSDRRVRPLTTAGQVFERYTGADEEEESASGLGGPVLVDLGRDEKLQRVLLTRINVLTARKMGAPAK